MPRLLQDRHVEFLGIAMQSSMLVEELKARARIHAEHAEQQHRLSEALAFTAVLFTHRIAIAKEEHELFRSIKQMHSREVRTGAPEA